MEPVQNEGGRDVLRETVFYNLDAIIAVGYRESIARFAEQYVARLKIHNVIFAAAYSGGGSHSAHSPSCLALAPSSFPPSTLPPENLILRQ